MRLHISSNPFGFEFNVPCSTLSGLSPRWDVNTKGTLPYFGNYSSYTSLYILKSFLEFGWNWWQECWSRSRSSGWATGSRAPPPLRQRGLDYIIMYCLIVLCVHKWPPPPPPPRPGPKKLHPFYFYFCFFFVACSSFRREVRTFYLFILLFFFCLSARNDSAHTPPPPPPKKIIMHRLKNFIFVAHVLYSSLAYNLEYYSLFK